jgi:hypothetical protein
LDFPAGEISRILTASAVSRWLPVAYARGDDDGTARNQFFFGVDLIYKF